MSYQRRLILILVCAGTFPLILLGYLTLRSSRQAVLQELERRLSGIRDIKKSRVLAYFSQIESSLSRLAEDPVTLQALKRLSPAFRALGAEKARQYYVEDNPHPFGQKDALIAAADGSVYSRAHRKYHPIFRRHVQYSRYYDLYLIDLQRDRVVYSIFKDKGFGADLTTPAGTASPLGRLLAQAKQGLARGEFLFSDFQFFESEFGVMPAAFTAMPLFDGEELLGLVAVQIPADELNTMMLEEAGLGETGKVYLVGKDARMRSQHRFSNEETFLTKEPFSEGIRRALRGEEPFVRLQDHRKHWVYGAYASLSVGDVPWVIAAEIDESEAMASARELRNFILLSVAAIAVLMLLIAVYLARAVSVPLIRLSAAMGGVARDEFKTLQEGADRSDEIGQLTRTFNTMGRALSSAQDKLRQANAELEQRVVERTRELAEANSDLRETQEKVVRTEKLAAIGQLASGVGHELRNPLGAIRNALYYVKDALKGSSILKEDPALEEFLGLADKEIHNATGIISDLLDFSRVVKLSLVPTDVHAVLRDMQAAVEIPAGVQVSEEYSRELPQARIDRQKMRQVFTNLAINALQAMPKGGKLLIRTRLEGEPADPKARVAVEFQDSGVGISPKDTDKIFEPLFTTKAKGTGLGLAICRGIVEAHGGEITFDSTPGKGTTFVVRFPAGGVQNGG